MNGYLELGSQEKNREDFAEPAETAGVYLNEIEGLRLHVLLEHDAVLAVLACSDFDVVLLDLLANVCVTEDVVGRGWFFDEEWLVLC